MFLLLTVVIKVSKGFIGSCRTSWRALKSDVLAGVTKCTSTETSFSTSLVKQVTQASRRASSVEPVHHKV